MTFEWGRLRKRIFDPIKKIWNICGALFSCSSYQETVLFIIIKKSLFWLMSRLFRWKLILTEKWILLPRKQKLKKHKRVEDERGVDINNWQDLLANVLVNYRDIFLKSKLIESLLLAATTTKKHIKMQAIKNVVEGVMQK